MRDNPWCVVFVVCQITFFATFGTKRSCLGAQLGFKRHFLKLISLFKSLKVLKKLLDDTKCLKMFNSRFILDRFVELFLHNPDVGADGDGREVDVGDGVVGALD